MTIADVISVVSSVLLIVVGVAAALVPELQNRLTKKIRIGLSILFCVVGIGGVISNRIQSNIQEQRFIGEATGGDTYCYFMAAPNMEAGDPPTYPLTLWVKGKYPMRNTVAQIQTVCDDPGKQLQSMRNIPLGDGTLLQGVHPIDKNFRVPIGKHIITIWSRRGLLNESLVLSMSNGNLQQTGDVFGNGKKLHDIAKLY